MTRKSILGIKYRLKAKTRIWGLCAFLGVYAFSDVAANLQFWQFAQKRVLPDCTNCTKAMHFACFPPFSLKIMGKVEKSEKPKLWERGQRLNLE